MTKSRDFQDLHIEYAADGAVSRVVGARGTDLGFLTKANGGVRAVTDPFTGGVAGLVGFPIVQAGSILCGFLGDSTVAGGLQSADGKPVQVSNNGTYTYPPAAIGLEQAGGKSWATFLCLQSNGRLILNHNGGNASDTSAGCLARLDYEIAQRPQVMFLQLGIHNDVSSAVPAATSKANVAEAVSRVKAAGIYPILVTSFPENVDATNVAIRALNEWLKAYGMTNRVPVLDLYPSVVDPAETTGNFLAAYTADGTHPNSLGAQVAANWALKQLIALGLIGAVPEGPYFNRLANINLGVGVNNGLNMLNNPLFNQNSGAVTATSWSPVTFTGAASINGAPGTGVLGSSQVLTLAAGQTLGDYRQQITTVAGKRYAFAGLFKTTGMQAANNVFSIGKLSNTAGGCDVYAGLNFQGVDFANWTPFYVENVAISTSMRASPGFLSGTSGGAATMEFAMCRVACLDDL